VVVCSPFSVFRSGTSVLTTTSCVTPPTESCALTVVFPTTIVIEDRTSVENPVFAKVSLYVPATIEDVSYTPESFVTKVFETPVSTFTTVTVAPGTAAPVLSVTVPLMSPEFVLCANAVPIIPTARRTTNIVADHLIFIALPP